MPELVGMRCPTAPSGVGKPFDPGALDEPMRAGLAQAAEDGPEIMNWKIKFRDAPYPTRWNNLRPGDYGFDYIDRAAGALEGLFVHDRDQAEYFSSCEDNNAELLDGSKAYLLHFDKEQTPPTLKNGFWSITMYGPEFQLVKNPISRFSIGDRTRRLAYNPDGSLDIYIQNSPPADKDSNWLPSPPQGLFRLNYRIYLPDEARRTRQRLPSTYRRSRGCKAVLRRRVANDGATGPTGNVGNGRGSGPAKALGQVPCSPGSPISANPSSVCRRISDVRRRPAGPATEGVSKGLRLLVTEEPGDLRYREVRLLQVLQRQFVPQVVDESGEGGALRRQSAN